jgi:hypothetical protein
MTTATRSALLTLVLAAISLVLAVVTGIDWLGKPLRMVNLLKIIGLSMFAGVAWAQALMRTRRERLSTGFEFRVSAPAAVT